MCTTGMGAKRTLGVDSVRRQFLRSHPAPSRNRPYTYTPSAGGAVMSSLFIRVTSLCTTTVSSAQPLCALVTSCRMAVTKPCGLKKPVIQKQLGRPSNTQARNCVSLSSSSVYQKPMVAESHEIWGGGGGGKLDKESKHGIA